MERKNHKNQGAVNQCHSAYPPWSGHPGRKGRKFWGWTPSLLGTPTPNWPLPSSEGGDGNPAESEMNHLWLWGPRVRVASREARALSKLRPLHPSLVGPELPRFCTVRWGESQDGLREWLFLSVGSARPAKRSPSCSLPDIWRLSRSFRRRFPASIFRNWSTIFFKFQFVLLVLFQKLVPKRG